ncbi:Uncharacterized protein OBRU01_04561 [Operophtera brumata]|uniref:Uncharacterized protein n=1 Tax=Operophtera brumata TaxID=104452 RepID=A0A0L7LFP0_OPEBR|nr:Uncharacterized protein OBRU01_04561 [Operophtera brumata]
MYLGSISTTTNTPHKNEELKTNRTYQVTENIIDIPDDRTLPPIIRNFTIVRPLNFGNNTVAANNIREDNNTSGEDGSSEESNTDAQNNKDGELKKHSFSILHIKAEYDDKPVQTHNHQNVLNKVFGGIKEYVYSLKKGVVDGLHSFFHKHDNDDKPATEFHDKFHRNFDGIEDFGNEHEYYDGDDQTETFDY